MRKAYTVPWRAITKGLGCTMPSMPRFTEPGVKIGRCLAEPLWAVSKETKAAVEKSKNLGGFLDLCFAYKKRFENFTLWTDKEGWNEKH